MDVHLSSSTYLNAAATDTLPFTCLMKNPPPLIPVFAASPSSLCPLYIFVYSNLFSPFILTEPHTLFFGGQFFKLSCWFLQEVAAVPTRSQEPVVPPTLIAVSTFPICFLFPIKFSLFIKS